MLWGTFPNLIQDIAAIRHVLYGFPCHRLCCGACFGTWTESLLTTWGRRFRSLHVEGQIYNEYKLQVMRQTCYDRYGHVANIVHIMLRGMFLDLIHRISPIPLVISCSSCPQIMLWVLKWVISENWGHVPIIFILRFSNVLFNPSCRSCSRLVGGRGELVLDTASELSCCRCSVKSCIDFIKCNLAIETYNTDGRPPDVDLNKAVESSCLLTRVSQSFFCYLGNSLLEPEISFHNLMLRFTALKICMHYLLFSRWASLRESPSSKLHRHIDVEGSTRCFDDQVKSENTHRSVLNSIKPLLHDTFQLLSTAFYFGLLRLLHCIARLIHTPLPNTLPDFSGAAWHLPATGSCLVEYSLTGKVFEHVLNKSTYSSDAARPGEKATWSRLSTQIFLKHSTHFSCADCSIQALCRSIFLSFFHQSTCCTEQIESDAPVSSGNPNLRVY